MTISPYVARIRQIVGTDLLLLPSVGALIFDGQGRLLVVHDVNTETWVVAGGSVEPLEAPADALIREVGEELGIAVRPVRVAAVLGGPPFVVRYRNGDRVSYVLTLFECVPGEGSLVPDGGEVDEIRWVSIDELLALPLQPWARHALPHLMTHRDQVVFSIPDPAEANLG